MLRDNKFETSYDTNFDNDIVSSFYEPALSSCNKYKRMAGFFRSSSFSIVAEGIANFIENEGKMQILACPFFSEEDLQMINLIHDSEKFDEKLSEILNRELTTETIQEKHVEALGWMLAHDLLEIRIVLVKNEEGDIFSDDLFHNKVGIISDDFNTVVFSGSINETLSGWDRNIEEFDVFCDWIDPPERIEKKVNNFNKYWEIGDNNRKRTIPLPKAVKEKWIKSIPYDKQDLKIYNSKNEGPKLRNYQKEAIENWVSNGYCGIFNMATGTGKTFTALYALLRLLKDYDKNIIVIISVPLQHLIKDPWHKSLETIFSNSDTKTEYIYAFNSSKKWIPDAKNKLEYFEFGIISRIIFLTTYDTLCSDNFVTIMKETHCEKIIIADEVHNSGSSEHRGGLLEDYNFRLGLSATPARYLDDDGTNFINNYFKGEVYEFSLERAINEINPTTGKTYLTPYYYHPLFVTATPDELDEYNKYTTMMRKYVNRDDLSPTEIEKYNMLLIQRSKIIKNAKNKLRYFIDNIDKFIENGIIEHCLIYCSDGRDPENDDKIIHSIVRCLNSRQIRNNRFTANEKPDERATILSNFTKGDVKALVAIKCLDEGVDVPSTKNAIIMASTGNPREYIQRRGRVLRRCDEKEYAMIFDFIVIPNKIPYDIETELSIFNNELKRFHEFSDHSLNSEDNNHIVNQLFNN